MANFNEYNRQRYEAYLKTIDWYTKARNRAKIDNYKCCMCGSIGTQNNPLQAHHITYKNLYHEDIYKDLITLCRNCHKSVHRMMNRITDKSGRKGWKDNLVISNHVLEGSEAVEIPD